jgi:hypothetical protein
MSTSLRFPNEGDILFNADHIVSIQCLEKQVEEVGLPHVEYLFQPEYTICLVCLQVNGCGKMDIENGFEADTCQGPQSANRKEEGDQSIVYLPRPGWRERLLSAPCLRGAFGHVTGPALSAAPRDATAVDGGTHRHLLGIWDAAG